MASFLLESLAVLHILVEAYLEEDSPKVLHILVGAYLEEDSPKVLHNLVEDNLEVHHTLEEAFLVGSLTGLHVKAFLMVLHILEEAFLVVDNLVAIVHNLGDLDRTYFICN